MLAIVFAFTLLGIGFVAGYATREKISRRRRTEYLLHEPYLPRMMKVEMEHDHTRASGGQFLRPPSASPAVSVADQERLHKLLRRLQWETQQQEAAKPTRALIDAQGRHLPYRTFSRRARGGLVRIYD
jgi:hypothetical protein